MADTITKILIRQGTNDQRLTANGTGVVFDSAEPGFCVDTKRLFIGDGTTIGGWPVGIQNLGKVAQLYDSSGNFTSEAQAIVNAKGVSVGDIIYDNTTKLIYTAETASYPPSPSDFSAFDTSIKYDSSNFTLNQDGQLSVKQGGIYSNNLDSGVVDNITIVKPSYSEPIALRKQGITNEYLATMPLNSVKANIDGYTNSPTDLALDVNTIVGRRSGNLEAIPIGELLSTAFIAGAGISLDTVGTRVRINLDPIFIEVSEAQVNINKPLSVTGATGISGPFSVYDDGFVQGTLRVGQDVVAFTSSDLRLKEDLNPIENAIEKTTSLTGYEFTYNTNAPKEIQGEKTYGLIAQDVKRVLPLAVNERSSRDNNEAYLGVNYEKIIPLLVEAIKELNSKLNTAKKCNCCNK